MDYSILVGGSAGQGVETLASILEKILKRNGFKIFTIRDYMSRVRGGHNFIQIRFGDQPLTGHETMLDVILAMDADTISNHIGRLKESGIALHDENISLDDKKAWRIALKAIAKRAGNSRVAGTAGLGAVLKLFNLELATGEKVLSEFFKGEILESNLQALREGYTLVEPRFTDAVPAEDDNLLINGNEALAMGVLAAGCKFYSAYPMTPSTSIMNYLASKMEEAEIVVEQAEDEIAAINMAIGASYAGVRAMTGTSGGGFALMVEAVGLSAMQEIPLVIAEIQRPGPTTGLPTRTEQGDLKCVISATPGEFPRMVIAMKNPEDAFYQATRAFNLADKYQIPVILLGDQFLADSTITIKPFDFDKVEIRRYIDDGSPVGPEGYQRYKITENGVSPRMIPGKVAGVTVLVDSDEHDEYGHITESAQVRVVMTDKRLRKLQYLSEELQEPDFFGAEDFDTLLLAWGSMQGPVQEALGLLNQNGKDKYAGLVFGDIWPLPVHSLQRLSKQARKIVNIEQNATGQLASLIRECTGITCDGSVLKYDGRPLSAREIFEKLIMEEKVENKK